MNTNLIWSPPIFGRIFDLLVALDSLHIFIVSFTFKYLDVCATVNLFGQGEDWYIIEQKSNASRKRKIRITCSLWFHERRYNRGNSQMHLRCFLFRIALHFWRKKESIFVMRKMSKTISCFPFFLCKWHSIITSTSWNVNRSPPSYNTNRSAFLVRAKIVLIS